MTRRQGVLLGVAGALVLMQIGRGDRSNPPVTGDVAAPAEVAAVLRRACYDCHSNETAWPWYAHVAPISWLVRRDVTEGRRHLNFSEWDKLPPDKRERRRGACGRYVKSGDMPLWFYLPLHPAAKLDDAAKQVIEQWAATGAP